MTLAGRVAVVTGGTKGIGLAIANRFCENGKKVAVLGRDGSLAQAVAGDLTSQGFECIGLSCDVSQSAQVRETLKQINGHFGAIDVIVNSAGILDKYTIEEMPEEYWDMVMAINLKGPFLVMQEALPYLEKSKAPRIINIGSNAGRMGGYENGLAYSASKGGIIALTYGAARRLASKGITVNCVAPGTIESEMSANYDEEAKKRLIARFPVGRYGKPNEVAEAVCYFASEESSFTTGAVLDVNGGMFTG